MNPFLKAVFGCVAFAALLLGIVALGSKVKEQKKGEPVEWAGLNRR